MVMKSSATLMSDASTRKNTGVRLSPNERSTQQHMLYSMVAGMPIKMTRR